MAFRIEASLYLTERQKFESSRALQGDHRNRLRKSLAVTEIDSETTNRRELCACLVDVDPEVHRDPRVVRDVHPAPAILHVHDATPPARIPAGA